MSVARDVAYQIRRSFRLPHFIHEDVLDLVLWKLGAEAMPIPRHFPIREFRRGRYIGVRIDEPQASRCWLKGHGLGHFIFHRGDQLAGLDDWIVAKQEWLADLFAGWLLVGPLFERYRRYEDTQLTIWDLAEDAGVPPRMAWRWVRMAERDVAA